MRGTGPRRRVSAIRIVAFDQVRKGNALPITVEASKLGLRDVERFLRTHKGQKSLARSLSSSISAAITSLLPSQSTQDPEIPDLGRNLQCGFAMNFYSHLPLTQFS